MLIMLSGKSSINRPCAYHDIQSPNDIANRDLAAGETGQTVLRFQYVKGVSFVREKADLLTCQTISGVHRNSKGGANIGKNKLLL